MGFNGSSPGGTLNESSAGPWLLGFACATFVVDTSVVFHGECSFASDVSLEAALTRLLKWTRSFEADGLLDASFEAKAFPEWSFVEKGVEKPLEGQRSNLNTW